MIYLVSLRPLQVLFPPHPGWLIRHLSTWHRNGEVVPRLTPARFAHGRHTLSLAKNAPPERTKSLPHYHQSVNVVQLWRSGAPALLDWLRPSYGSRRTLAPPADSPAAHSAEMICVELLSHDDLHLLVTQNKVAPELPRGSTVHGKLFFDGCISV